VSRCHRPCQCCAPPPGGSHTAAPSSAALGTRAPSWRLLLLRAERERCWPRRVASATWVQYGGLLSPSLIKLLALKAAAQHNEATFRGALHKPELPPVTMLHKNEDAGNYKIAIGSFNPPFTRFNSNLVRLSHVRFVLICSMQYS